MNNKGKLGEEIAVNFLITKGYKIIKRNFRTKFGEIDIIAEKGNDIIFIEVKYRKNKKFGKAEDSINYFKLKKIKNTAKFFLNNFYLKNKNPRIDIIAINNFDNIEITHYKNVEID